MPGVTFLQPSIKALDLPNPLISRFSPPPNQHRKPTSKIRIHQKSPIISTYPTTHKAAFYPTRITSHGKPSYFSLLNPCDSIYLTAQTPQNQLHPPQEDHPEATPSSIIVHTPSSSGVRDSLAIYSLYLTNVTDKSSIEFGQVHT